MSFTTYANTGPFNNNALPALTATFFNNIEVFLDQIKSSAVADVNISADGSGNLTVGGKILANMGGTQVNGSVGGNVLFLTPCWGGGLKIVMADVNAWNSTSPATFVFPAGNMGWGFFICGPLTGTMNVTLQNGASLQNVKHLTALGATNASGTDSGQTAFNGDNIGTFAGIAADRLVVGSNTSAATFTLVIIGN